MIRILHIVTYMGRGGIETMLMNYYRNIDRSKLQFDFLVHRDLEADYDKEILEMGGKIYRLPTLNPISFKYITQIKKFFREHKEYKIVHSHIDCMSSVPLKYAKKNGVPIRIAHSHNNSNTMNLKYFLKLYFRSKLDKYVTDRFACSKEAGEFLHRSNSFHMLNNAIDTQKFLFIKDVRDEVRKEFGIKEDTIIVGSVARFMEQKNHSFIVDIFAELLKQDDNAVLMLVGDGHLKNQIEEKCASLDIGNKVIFTGVRTDVQRLLQAMDVNLFPSLFEGLPVSIIEAQAAGLPCLISNKVPIECKKTNLVEQMDLSYSAKQWATKVIEMSKIARRDTFEEIKEAGFDIGNNAIWLQHYYIEKYNSL